MRLHRSAFGTLVVLALIVGCGRGDEAPPPRDPTPLDLTTTGRIVGTVRFDGTPPPMGTINFGSFIECTERHGEPVATGEALVHDGLVENAFVWIEEGLGDRVFAIPDEPVVIDQRGCLYEPRVVGAQVGQAVKYVNSDRTLHNVHGTPRTARGWNFALSRAGSERVLRIMEPEVAIPVRCDLHPWMQGWIGVVDHPYHAVTGPDGRFRLDQVPPGRYVVGVWHERFGRREATVELTPQREASIDFTYAAD